MIVSSNNIEPKTKIKKPVKKDILDEFIADKSLDETAKLRPSKLSEYIGQEKIRRQLQIILDSSKIREKLPEHILFYGQPGLGKTTLANLISKELGVKFKVVSAPALQKIGDIVSLLLNLEEKTVLFIDEIHRLKLPLEETLYTAMEDLQVDLVMGKGHGAQSTRLDLPEFTLVGATTQLGKLSKPLKDRFGTVFNLEPYSESEVLDIVDRNCAILNLKMEEDAKILVCKRSRGVPRVTNNILKRILDYTVVHKIKSINKEELGEFLIDMGVYIQGLTNQDLNYMRSLLKSSVSLKTLSGLLLEETDTIEQVIEPYLIYLGFIDKSSEGRRLTPKGREFILRFDGVVEEGVLV